MKKRGRGEEKLYKKRKEERCEFKNLILGVLTMSMNRKMNGELKKRAEAEGERGKKRRGRGGEGEEEEEEKKKGEK